MLSFASKDSFFVVEKDVTDLKERVSKCEFDINALKEIIANGGGKGDSK
jgi:hypothetical protein